MMCNFLKTVHAVAFYLSPIFNTFNKCTLLKNNIIKSKSYLTLPPTDNLGKIHFSLYSFESFIIVILNKFI